MQYMGPLVLTINLNCAQVLTFCVNYCVIVKLSCNANAANKYYFFNLSLYM